MLSVYKINPVPKPRMTQQDKWKKRKPVLNYWFFKDHVRLLGVKLREGGDHVVFIIPMPPSWSKKKQAQLVGKPHQQKPDKDNLEKALLDALFDDDCAVWDGRTSKLWGISGAIVVGGCDDSSAVFDCAKNIAREGIKENVIRF
jgi:Holliday junction resolvase RusA-like endonuclease